MNIERLIHNFARGHTEISRIELFGSAARGETGEGSDVDLLLTFLPQSRVSLLDLAKIQAELEEALGRPVDVLTRQAVEASRNSVRREQILREAATIYEA